MDEKTKTVPGTTALAARADAPGGPPARRGRERLGLLEVSDLLARSGCFGGVREAAQAFARILYGTELGLSPVASMCSIYFYQGAPRLSASAMASLIRRSGRYDYDVEVLERDRARLRFRRADGTVLGVSEFSMADATAAGLARNPTYRAHPRNMLFARALSNGFRWFTPDLSHGVSLYGPLELPGDDDLLPGDLAVLEDEGRVIPATVVPASAAAPVAAEAAGPTDDRPLDEEDRSEEEPWEGEGAAPLEAPTPAQVAAVATAAEAVARSSPPRPTDGATTPATAPSSTPAPTPAPAADAAPLAAALGVRPGDGPLAPDAAVDAELADLPLGVQEAVRGLALDAAVPPDAANALHHEAKRVHRTQRAATAAWRAVGVTPGRGAPVTLRQVVALARNLRLVAAANGGAREAAAATAAGR